MYQFKIRLGGGNVADGELTFAFTDDTYESTTRLSIEKDGAAYYFRIYVDNVVEEEYEITTAALETIFLRIWYDSQNDTIRIYNGTSEVITYESVDWRDLVFNLFDCYAARSTNTNISLRIEEWKMISNLEVDI